MSSSTTITTRPPRTGRRRAVTFPRVVVGLLLVAGLGAAMAAAWPTTRWAHGTGYAITERNAELYPLVAGHVAARLVESGARVEQGQPLVQLNDDVQRLALAAAPGDERLKLELAQRTIRAPLAGVVYLHRFDAGEYVTPDRALGQVFDPSRWVVRVQLAERALPHVKVGQRAEVHLAAHHTLGGRALAATVSRIDPVVTPRGTGDGVFAADLSIDPPPDLLIEPGMTAWARIDAGRTTWLRRALGY